jgi:penicillin-binding protein 2
MYLDDGGRRPTLTPQLALRIAIIGGIALVAFAVIFFRLWYLQVLSGDKYERVANDNQVREIKVQAPRGEIVDREGRVLVENRTGLAVKITPDKLPEGRRERMDLYRGLARVLGLRPGRIRRNVNRQLKALPFSTAVVKSDVSDEVVAYLLERQEDFPGVQVERQFLRQYPHGEVGAHLFGFISEVNKEQLKDERYRGVSLGDRVGQAGIEYQYDRFLRGRNGATRLQVDALGRLRKNLAVKQPKQGRQLRLSVDLDVQQAGQAALAGGTGQGAFAVMDVKNGEILGLGSHPSYDPNIFAKVIRESDYKRLTDEDNGAPLTNRAIQGGYPTGSTFKLFTSVAALESGLITPDSVLFDGGSLTVGGVTFKNAGGAAHGALALRQALTVSSDVFFYQLGQRANEGGAGGPIQKWGRRLGLGRRTGIDLPNELPGLLPTPRWRDHLYDKKLTDRPWSVGDNINLAVGQGDLKASPMQLAVAYAAIANGGKIVRPHLGQQIEDSSGRVLQELEPATPRKLPIDESHRQAILDGLRGAASESGGTSTAVFAGFPIPIAGKTGTAEKGLGRADQSWYCALAPYPDVQYVTCVTDEAGGFGAETAAPMARDILATLFNVRGDEGGEGGVSD